MTASRRVVASFRRAAACQKGMAANSPAEAMVRTKYQPPARNRWDSVGLGAGTGLVMGSDPPRRDPDHAVDAARRGVEDRWRSRRRRSDETAHDGLTADSADDVQVAADDQQVASPGQADVEHLLRP